MKLHTAAISVMVTLGVGCSYPSNSDVIGPRTTKFKSDVTFAVHATTKASDTSTIDRPHWFTRKLFHLVQPPLATKADVKSVALNEAIGVSRSVTIIFDEPTTERFAIETQKGGTIAVLINEEILCTFPTDGTPISKLTLPFPDSEQAIPRYVDESANPPL